MTNCTNTAKKERQHALTFKLFFFFVRLKRAMFYLHLSLITNGSLLSSDKTWEAFLYNLGSLEEEHEMIRTLLFSDQFHSV